MIRRLSLAAEYKDDLPNVCAKNLWDLNEGAHRSLKRMRRRPRLIFLAPSRLQNRRGRPPPLAATDSLGYFQD